LYCKFYEVTKYPLVLEYNFSSICFDETQFICTKVYLVGENSLEGGAQGSKQNNEKGAKK
jgi:hypothetical protein